jgi:hypothetical protein
MVKAVWPKKWVYGFCSMLIYVNNLSFCDNISHVLTILCTKNSVRYDRFFPRIDTVFWSRSIVDWSCPRYLFLINTCVVNIVYSGYGNIDSAREAGFEQVFWIFTWNISMNGWKIVFVSSIYPFMIKGSLGGETSVLRTFRMSGKELVKERVSQGKVS